MATWTTLTDRPCYPPLPGSEDRKRMVAETDGTNPSVPLVSREVFGNLR